MPAKPPPTTTKVSRRSRSGPCGQVGGLDEVLGDLIADRDRLFDVLQADRVVGDARDREGARDGAGRHHDDVVVDVPRLADLGRDGRLLVGVVDVRDLGRDDLGALEVTTVRDDRVTRLDAARRDLREERLVGHVGKRVDHGDVGFASSQPLLELLGRVEAGVAAADDQDFAHRWGYSSLGKVTDNLSCAAEPSEIAHGAHDQTGPDERRSGRRPAPACPRAAAA